MGKPATVYLSLNSQADPPASSRRSFQKMDALPRGRNIRVKELQMRKLFYFTSILLITAGMTFAQAGSSGSGSTSGSTGAPSSSDQGTAPGAQTTPPADQSGSSAT